MSICENDVKLMLGHRKPEDGCASPQIAQYQHFMSSNCNKQLLLRSLANIGGNYKFIFPIECQNPDNMTAFGNLVVASCNRSYLRFLS